VIVGSAAAGAATAEGGGGGDDASAWPGVIGVALGALALVGVGLLWASRPATLPADGPGDVDAAP
jgi:hypothetical protein